MVIHTDNAFLDEAIDELVNQYTNRHRTYRGKPHRLDVQSGCVVIGGTDDPKAYLELKQRRDGKLSAKARDAISGTVEDLGPVDCYNLILPGEDMGAAVRRVFAEA